LTKLSLAGNQLTTVPDWIGQLTNLTELYLWNNQLTTVPDSIGQLTNLTKLYLGNNQLTSVPEAIGQLTNLTKLYLTGNQLTTVPDWIGQLTNLTELYLTGNQLTAVPEAIGQLTNLTKLSLAVNQLTRVPEGIGQLTNLTELALKENQLTSVPEAIGQFTNLTKLSLAVNQLKRVPEGIGQLTNLTELYLWNNQLTAVPEAIGQLTNLTKLSLGNNQLTTVPEEISQLTNLTELYLHGNEQLRIPQEILGPSWNQVLKGAKPANPQDILNYYFRALAAQKPLNEAKLILVGHGAVGKTSLVNRLVNQAFDPGSQKTEGIEITQWNLRLPGDEAITLNVWDFGGQEIMHATHQFFLTDRSLYLLVLNGRQGHEDEDAEYWLELIQSFGGGSPVIVVLNKVGEHPFDVNRNALRQKFANIRDFIPTDCKTQQGIDQLRSTIETVTDQLEHLRDPFPASWFEIKQQLATMADNYISFDRFRAICCQDGESDPQAQNALASYLHSLGIALNYSEDPRLRDTHVLNPRWVTNGIYRLLNAHDLSASRGELAMTELSDMLDLHQYPLERHSFLLELMRKFELCFRFPEDDDRYLIPELLDKQQPPEAGAFDPRECLNFRYAYPILPEGLMPRFIVRTHVLSQPKWRWRMGTILAFEDNQALVKADRQDRYVTIYVNGPQEGRRRLLAIIRSDFERIHSSFKFKPKEEVPHPAYPELVINYQKLQVMESKGLKEFQEVIGDDVITINVQELLRGVDLPEPRRRKPFPNDDWQKQRAGSDRSALRLFYSYSQEDETLRDTLETRLKLLQRQGLIQPWHDRRIPPGSDWQSALDNHLEQADIILLLVSHDFLASDYCYGIEMGRALERHRAGEALVMPILLRPVDWNKTPISHLQALPTGLKPVTQWSDADEAWLDIEQGIGRAIEARWGDGFSGFKHPSVDHW
jgi:internalin A